MVSANGPTDCKIGITSIRCGIVRYLHIVMLKVSETGTRTGSDTFETSETSEISEISEISETREPMPRYAVRRAGEAARFCPGKSWELDAVKLLDKSLNAGLLTELEHKSKKARLGLVSTVGSAVELPGASDQRTWLTVGHHADYEQALKSVKQYEVHGRYKWANSPGKPGDRRFKCNEHVDCPSELRIKRAREGNFLVQIDAGTLHATVPNAKRRKNAVLSFDQEEQGEALMKQGIMYR